MKTVKIEVRSVDAAMEEAVKAVESSVPISCASITFVSNELLQQVLSVSRRQILYQLCGAAPMAVRELAERVGCDVQTVHGDVDALLQAGVVHRKRGGAISFPYDQIIYPAPDSGGKYPSRCSQSGASS